MAQNIPHQSIKDIVVDTALSMAVDTLWSDLSYEEIIKKADVNPLEASEYFDDKDDIIIAYGRRVDRKVFENISFGEGEMSEREKIFDILMERFDVLNENREALLSILDSFKSEPKQMMVSLPHLARSMSRTLDAAGVEADGMFGVARVTGLIGVYLYVVRAWKDDDSADMAKTMAALDKALDYGEQAANSCQDGNILSGLSNLSGLCSRFTRKNDDL